MDIVVDAVVRALQAAGLRCRRASPMKLAASPTPGRGEATVQLAHMQLRDPGFGRPAGTDGDGRTVACRAVLATVEIALYCAPEDGMAALDPMCEQALWALSENGALSEMGMEAGQAVYDDTFRALRQVLTVKLSGLLLATGQEDGSVLTDFILKGSFL